MADDLTIKVGADTRDAEAALGKVTSALKAFASIAISGAMAKSIMDIADQAQVLSTKLLQVTGNTADANKAFSSLAQVSKQTGVGLAENVQLYQRMIQSDMLLGSTQASVENVMKAFNRTMLESGMSTSEVAAATDKLGEAYQEGAIDMRAWKSIIEPNAALLNMLKEVTGKTTTELKFLASNGLLSLTTITRALENSKQATEDYATAIDTIPKATTYLQTSIMEAVKKFDDMTGASDKISTAIVFLADNITGIAIAAVMALGGAFLYLNAAAAPWLLAATAIVAAVVAIGVGIQKLIDAMDLLGSKISIWDRLTATIDTAASKVAGFLGISYELSETTKKTNETRKVEIEQTNQQAAAIEKVTKAKINYVRQAPVLALDKSLREQISAMNSISALDAQITDLNRTDLEVQKAINAEKAKYVLLNDKIPPALEKQLALAVRQREEAKLSQAGLQFILENQDQYSKLTLDQAKAQREITAAVRIGGADPQQARIATERLINNTLKERADILSRDPSITMFDRLKASSESLLISIKMNNKEAAALVEHLNKGGELPTGTSLVKPGRSGSGLAMGGGPMDPNKDMFKEILNNEVTYNLEAIRLNQELYDTKLGIAEQYYATVLRLEKDALGNQMFGAETAKSIASERTAFEKKSETEKASWAIEQGASVFNEMGKYNRQAFAAAKAFNIANAIMNTYMGATKALATYPPPFNFIGAAATIAFGLLQVATISAQQYSGRATGGGVTGGTSYMVGEKGPELFTPGAGGTITPNNALGGRSQQVNVNFNINMTDARGVDQLIMERKGMIVSMIRSAITDRGMSSPV